MTIYDSKPLILWDTRRIYEACDHLAGVLRSLSTRAYGPEGLTPELADAIALVADLSRSAACVRSIFPDNRTTL